jgi:signal transduction histidine kinase
MSPLRFEMPITNKTFIRSTAILMLVGLMALAGIVGTNIWLVERSQGYFQEVIEARTIRRASVDLLSALQDMETGQRGYLLTHDTKYLEPYEIHIANVDRNFQELNFYLGEIETAQPAVAQLEANIAYKRTELADTLDLARTEGFPAAVEHVRTDSGKQAMDEIREFLNRVMDGADNRLATGAENQEITTNILRIVTVAGGAIILIVVSVSIWTMISYMRQLAIARNQIEEANVGLESRVAERTHELGKANEEIQRFAYIVTHDLRAPLVNIMGFTSEMETGIAAVRSYMEVTPPAPEDALAEAAHFAASEDLPEAITFIRAATRKMDGLINAILKISREGRRTLRPESTNLKQLVESSAAALHHQLVDDQGEITFDIKVNELFTDRLSVEQVLGNMLDNAIKYQSPQRPLHVQIKARNAPGNRVIIEVSDNGRGIADADHERVFELFRRSGSQNNPGEGIGLAHVRTMVRSLGGDVKLASKLGEGTTFTIDLPRDVRSYLKENGA